MIRQAIIISAFLALVLFMQGCCGACNLGDKLSQKVEEELGEKITEGLTGGQVDISNGNVTIKDSTGSYDYAEEVDLSDYDLNRELMYPGAKARYVMVSDEPDFSHCTVVFETGDNPREAVTRYKNLGGWETVMETSTTEGYLIQIKKDKTEATVSTYKDSSTDRTMVSVIYVEYK
ncbi:hypothetical protein JW890_07280 [candidate division WOR-3 bacterium]|nr:hypothetical protein [candidate division WOR-3 bacterium]